MAFQERFIVWTRFLALVTFVLLLILYFFGFFDDGRFLYKPCAEAGNDQDKWYSCVDYYMKEEGWTYNEIVNGIVIEEK